jgi:hypothetical protein
MHAMLYLDTALFFRMQLLVVSSKEKATGRLLSAKEELSGLPSPKSIDDAFIKGKQLPPF